MHIRKYNIYEMMLRGPADRGGEGGDDLDVNLEGDDDGQEHEEAGEEDGEQEDGERKPQARKENAEREEPDEDDEEGAGVLNGEGDDEDDEQEDPAPRVAAKGRKTLQDKFREERARARAERERNDRIEKELNDLRAERQREKAREDAQSEADRLALMLPEERVQYELNKMRDETRRHNEMLAFKQADDSDRMKFEQRAAADPIIAKRAQRVEQELMNLRKNVGINAKREDVLALIIGREVLERKSAPKKTVQKTVARGKPPASGRGDAASARRQSASTAEKRLANVAI
jgi:hypothetical protein